VQWVRAVVQLRAETATHYISMAFDEDLNVAEVSERSANSRGDFLRSRARDVGRDVASAQVGGMMRPRGACASDAGYVMNPPTTLCCAGGGTGRLIGLDGIGVAAGSHAAV
jgi:hypothetical protein